MHVYAEYNDGTSTAPGWKQSAFGLEYSGENHQYTQSYSNIYHRVRIWEDNNELLDTPWDPEAYRNGQQIWTSPWFPHWLGEVHDDGDQMPGIPTSPVHFTSQQVQTQCIGCSWSNPSGVYTYDNTPLDFGVTQITANTAYDVFNNYS